MCADPKSLHELVRGHGHRLIPPQRPCASPTELARRGIVERNRDPRKRSNGELRDPLPGYRAPQAAALRRRDPADRPPPAQRRRLQEHQVHERTYLLVADPEIEISPDASTVTGGSGLLSHSEPNQRAPDGARAQRRPARARARPVARGGPPSRVAQARSQPRELSASAPFRYYWRGRHQPARLASSSPRPRRATATTRCPIFGCSDSRAQSWPSSS